MITGKIIDAERNMKMYVAMAQRIMWMKVRHGRIGPDPNVGGPAVEKDFIFPISSIIFLFLLTLSLKKIVQN